MDKEKLKQLAEQYGEEYYFETPVQFFMAGADIAIREVEMENAELNVKYDTCLRENTGLKIHNAYVEKKLTEAKEIIRKFVEWANWQGNSKCPSFKIIQDKAAQFLEGSK